jgi:nucleoid-associated protein YgaU
VQAAFLVSAIYSGRSPLGSPTNQARTRLTRRLPVVAAPALVGVAAAFALANAHGSAGAPSATASHAHHTVVPAAHAAVRSAATAAARTPGAKAAARLLSATQPTAKHTTARHVSYTVKSGDTLSAIAGRFYGDANYWPVLYWANHSQIRYANEISVGQALTVPAKPAHIPGAPSVLGPAPAPSPVSVSAASQTSAQAPAPAQAAQAPQAAPVAAPVQSTAVSTAGGGSFQACVIQRESGGNSQVMNSSGHYGLYQFSASTWAEYGGNPADFGNASVAEQNQVFNNAIAAGGQSNWSAYDGC